METFVMRVWTPAERADDQERYRVRGFIEHVGSGEREPFHSVGELLAFLEARLEGKPEEVQQRP